MSWNEFQHSLDIDTAVVWSSSPRGINLIVFKWSYVCYCFQVCDVLGFLISFSLLLMFVANSEPNAL